MGKDIVDAQNNNLFEVRGDTHLSRKYRLNTIVIVTCRLIMTFVQEENTLQRRRLDLIL